MELICFALFLQLLILDQSFGVRIQHSIYTNLDETAFCFRRTNGTHQMGCTSKPSGNVGVVHLISSDANVSWLVDHGPHEPYIALITPKMFKGQALHTLKNSGKISGIVLLGANKTDELLKKNISALSYIKLQEAHGQ